MRMANENDLYLVKKMTSLVYKYHLQIEKDFLVIYEDFLEDFAIDYCEFFDDVDETFVEELTSNNENYYIHKSKIEYWDLFLYCIDEISGNESPSRWPFIASLIR